MLNSSINFVVYCFVGKRFRNTLISFFKGKSTSSSKYIIPTTNDAILQGRVQSYGGLTIDQNHSESPRRSLQNDVM